MLKPKVRTILTDEFKMVPNLRALFFVPERNMGNLYAQPRAGVDPTTIAELAFEAFKDAADRLMSEAPGAPYITWYGLTQAPIPGAEEIRL